LAIADRLGAPGAALDGAVRDAFASGLAGAMRAGALIAIAAAAFVAWRGPRRIELADRLDVDASTSAVSTVGCAS
jgi:hypothetical protein